MTDHHIHHLVRAAEWADVGDHYRPASLGDEGFIHFSTTEQIPDTSRRYYAGVTDLLVVTVDATVLEDELRWEDLHGTGVYPHLYGPLPTDAVVAIQPYSPGDAFGAI